MAKITANGSNLVVDGTEIDLSEHTGKKVTVFKDDDDSVTIESQPVHHVTICEFKVPKAVINSEKTGALDESGTPEIREVVTPLDISKTVITVFKEVVK